MAMTILNQVSMHGDEGSLLRTVHTHSEKPHKEDNRSSVI